MENEDRGRGEVALKLRLKDKIERIKRRNLPKHIAIIMDGNGRWAKRRGLQRTEGHRKGLQAADRVVEFIGRELGEIAYLTLFAFSTENWRRPKEEVNFLMDLIADFVRKKLDKLLRNEVRLRVFGELEGLPDRVRREVERAIELSQDNRGLNLSVALNYGGRQEILRAVRGIIKGFKAGEVGLSTEEVDIDEELFRRYLYTNGLPDPELLIRTAGEQRVSNFMLWQMVGAKFWVTQTLWPDFSEAELLEGLEYFQR
jgi:undecaprenyl diphosphate synthase